METGICQGCGVVVALSRVKWPLPHAPKVMATLGPKDAARTYEQRDGICPFCGGLFARELKREGKTIKVTPDLDLSKKPNGLPDEADAPASGRRPPQ